MTPARSNELQRFAKGQFVCVSDKIDKRTKKVLIALGEYVRTTREGLDVTQVQLAKAIGMEPTNLAKIERGTRNLTIDTLVRLAEGLETELVVKFAKRSRKIGA